MPRGSCFYSDRNSVGCGQDFFGLLFAKDGAPSLAFSYDFDKRVEAVRRRGERRAPGELSVTRLDYSANLFGTYRYQDAEIEDDVGMAALLDLSLKGDHGLRDDKKAYGSVAFLDGFGRGLYAQLDKVAASVLETPGFFACEKAELELEDRTEPRWMFPAAPEPESGSLASSSLESSSLESSSLESSGKPKSDEVVIDEPDALPEEPAAKGPALGLGDSGAPKGT